jgi:drug/metabolite transporter (DMT)-like permease
MNAPEQRAASTGRLLIITGLVVICIIWGSTWFAIKIGLQSLPPYLSVAIRFFLAAAILGVLLRLRNIEVPRVREFWVLAAILSVNTFSLPFALIYWGQQHIPTSLASILFATFPFCVAIFSHFRLPSERMTLVKWSGVAVGFAGVFIIFARELSFDADVHSLGMAAILTASVAQAYAVITLKKLGGPFHPMPTSFAGMLLGSVITFALSLAVEDYSTAVFDWRAVGSLLYLAAFGSVVTFVTYFWLLKRVDAVLLSLITFVTPILAIVLGTVWLKERLSPEVFLGSAFVLGGILLANASGMRNLIKKKKAIMLP